MPVVVDGSPDCQDLKGWVAPSRTFSKQVKFAAPVNGTSGGGMEVVIDPNNPPGTGIGWFVRNNEDVRAVIVKGGPSANVYFYPAHPEGDFVDGLMTTPGTLDKKGNLKFPTLGYMEFCFSPFGV